MRHFDTFTHSAASQKSQDSGPPCTESTRLWCTNYSYKNSSLQWLGNLKINIPLDFWGKNIQFTIQLCNNNIIEEGAKVHFQSPRPVVAGLELMVVGVASSRVWLCSILLPSPSQPVWSSLPFQHPTLERAGKINEFISEKCLRALWWNVVKKYNMFFCTLWIVRGRTGWKNKLWSLP